MIRIGGEDYPKEVVKSRLLKLDSGHIEYVIHSLHENTTKVRNIRAYLLTSLYYAPTTINSYYTALVNHDMYGSGVTVFSYSNEGGEPVLSGPPLVTNLQMNGTVSRTRTVRVHFILDAGPLVLPPGTKPRKERAP